MKTTLLAFFLGCSICLGQFDFNAPAGTVTASVQTISAPPPVTYTAISSSPSGSTRNLGFNDMGMAWACGVDLTITQVGVWNISGNSGTAHLKIFRGTIVYSDYPVSAASFDVTIDLSTAATGQYVYVTLPTPLVCLSGDNLTFTVTDGNTDTFYEDAGYTFSADLGGTLFSIYGFNLPANHASIASSPNNAFGPVNFKYTKP